MYFSEQPDLKHATIVLLSSLRPGQSGQVYKVSGSPAICQRLLEMGVTGGTSIEVIRFAPLGDPMEIKIRGYRLLLRRKEAEHIKIAFKKQE